MTKKSQEHQPIEFQQYKPELVIPNGHGSTIFSICFSLDCRMALTGDIDGKIILWDIQNGQEIRSFEGHDERVLSVCFSTEGLHALSAGADGTFRVWDINTGRKIRSIEGHSQNIERVCFSLDGQFAFSVSRDGMMELWDIPKGAKIRTFESFTDACSVCFSPDNRFVLSGGFDQMIKLWDSQKGQLIRTFKGHTGHIESVCFSPDGRQALSGSSDRKLKLWDISTGKEIQSFEGHEHYVSAVCFSPDGRFAISASYDHSIKLWEIQTGEEVYSFEGHTSYIFSICVASNGRYALSGSVGGYSLKLWDIQSRQEKLSLKGHKGAVSSIAITPDGRHALSGSDDSTIKLWDLNKGLKVRSFEGHKGTVSSIGISPNGRLALSGSNDKSLKLWDIQTGQEIRSFEGHTEFVTSVCFSPDGMYALSGSWDGTIILWDIFTGQEIRSFTGKGVKVPVLSLFNANIGIPSQVLSQLIYTVCFSPDGHHALSGHLDNTVKLWDIQTGKEIQSLEGHAEAVHSVCFSLDGQQALSGSDDCTIRLWDVQTGQEICSYEGHKGRVWSVCYSPNGQLALSGSDDGTIKLWDLESGNQLRSFIGHKSVVESVCFSPDGRFVLSGSSDHTLRLWEIETGKEIASLISLDSDDWIINSPSGLFDASEGAFTKMHYTIGLETIDFDQLVGMYHIPGLLSFLLSGSKEILPKAPPIENIRLHPSMEAIIENDTLILNLDNRGGGIGKVLVYVENIEIIRDARKEPQKDQSQERLTIRIDLMAYQKFFIPTGPNRLTVFSENENGTLRSKPIHIDYSSESLVSKGGRQSETATQPLKKEADRPLKMHAIFIGSNTQGSSNNKLKYAARDANEMASVAKAAGQELYGEENMVISVFSGENLSKKEILEEFNRMQELTTEDVVMIFLSGHGTTKGEFKEYYYLLKDWDPTVSIETMIATPWMRDIYTLSIRELQELVNSIPARKRILILDTCQSGSISGHFSGAKSIDLESSSQLKVIGEVRRSTGFCVLSGCAGDKESFEYVAYQHGLMTYAILLGISTGEGLLEKEGKQYIEPLKLFNYVKAKTENLANSLNHTQKPELSIPESLAGDFFLGEVTPAQKQAIKLTELKMFTWSNINPIKPKDELELSQKMDQFLDKCAKRGELVYTEREDSPDVYQIVGNYRLVNEFIMIDSWIKRGGKFVEGSEKEIKCKAFEVDKVAWEIFRLLHTS